MFDIIVGRLFFKTGKVKTYGTFSERKAAEEYAGFRQGDLAPNGVLFIASPGIEPLFLREDGRQWDPCSEAVVYDCSIDAEKPLSDYMRPDDVMNLIRAGLQDVSK